ncbi:MAG: hypothetical protein GX556_04865 [Fibrobacter sp.]|nr:hypothetical protein [Fibrobacter sp.]
MFRKSLIIISLFLINSSFASGSDYIPYSEGNNTEEVYANGTTLFDLDNLWYSARFKNGEGNATTELSHVSYMVRAELSMIDGERTNESRTLFGSGIGHLSMDLGAGVLLTYYSPNAQHPDFYSRSSSGFPGPDAGIPKEAFPASGNTFSRGEFYYDVEAENLIDITFRLPSEQYAGLSTTGGAEGAVQVTSSFALYNHYDPISPDPLDSQTRSIRFKSEGGVEMDRSREWKGDYEVSYHFKTPFTGNLLLKGSFLNSTRANTAGAPEPSLLITMAVSLVGFLAIRFRKTKVS